MKKRRKKKDRRGRRAKFFVFYDKNDFVKCCGTAKELVEEGWYSSVGTVWTTANKIKNGIVKGTVVMLRGYN